MNKRNITILTIILSGTFYIGSLTQEAYCTHDCKSSFMVLLVGILGTLTETGAIANFIMDKINGQTSSISNDLGATFTWLANPIILFSLFTFKRRTRTTLKLSIISTILILLFLVFDKVLDNGAGHYSKVTELKSGYWLWLFSSLTIFTGSLIITKMTMDDNEKKKAL